MKKVIAMFLLVFAISVCLPSSAAADVKVRLNGEELRCIQEKPFLKDGVVFVPARALMDAMGGQVEGNYQNTVRLFAFCKQPDCVSYIMRPSCSRGALFHCDAFGEVARFIDIAAALDRDIISE